MTVLDELWPPELAEDWDTVGLAVGNPQAEVARILLALDPTDATIDQAISSGADLLLTHHPLLLRGVTAVHEATLKGGMISKLIAAGVATANAHTNADAALGGVSDVLARAIGIRDARPLAAPGSAEAVPGLGRVGAIDRAMRLDEFATLVAQVLPSTAAGIRVAGDPGDMIRTVAVCGGAGDGFFDLVRASGADAYVTADLRHHPATEARDTAHRGGADLALVDVSHWASESLWLPFAAEQLREALASRGHSPEIEVSQTPTDPWTFTIASPRPL